MFVILILWFSFTISLFIFTKRVYLRRVPLVLYSTIRAFAFSQLIAPTIFGFWTGAIPVPAALVVYYGLYAKINGKMTRLVSENTMFALKIWIFFYMIIFLWTCIRTYKIEKREQTK